MSPAEADAHSLAQLTAMFDAVAKPKDAGPPAPTDEEFDAIMNGR